MKKLALIPALIAATLSSCSNVPTYEDRIKAGEEPLVEIRTVSPGIRDAFSSTRACKYGAEVVRMGFDDNKDGILSPDEVKKVHVICIQPNN